MGKRGETGLLTVGGGSRHAKKGISCFSTTASPDGKGGKGGR